MKFYYISYSYRLNLWLHHDFCLHIASREQIFHYKIHKLIENEIQKKIVILNISEISESDYIGFKRSVEFINKKFNEVWVVGQFEKISLDY